MAAAVPDPQDIERFAARHVPGSGPMDIGPLGSGLVNRSYRVVRDGRQYSLRIAAPAGDEIGLGLDRAWECRVVRCASEAGLAPLVERCEPRAGVLVARWVDGDSWSADAASSRDVIESVARLTRRVHALPPPRRPRIVSPAQWIDFYRRALERLAGSGRTPPAERSGIDRRADALLEGLTREPALEAALCHGDLHVQNVVIDPRGHPIILDWEYAHVADPWWDLAGWACNGDLTAERRRALLGLYLGRVPETAEAARLGRLAWLYDYVCLLWCELYVVSRSGAKAPGDPVSLRAGQLSRRLSGNLEHAASGCGRRVPAH